MRLDHLAFPCFDAEATLRFHVDALGLPLAWAFRLGQRLTFAVALDGGRTLAFTCGEGIVPLAPTRAAGDVAHVGLQVSDAVERERWKRRLIAHNIRFTVEDEGADERLYFTDPNGVVLEIEAASPAPSQSPGEARELVRAWTRENRK